LHFPGLERTWLETKKAAEKRWKNKYSLSEGIFYGIIFLIFVRLGCILAYKGARNQMPSRTINETMDALSSIADDLDQIARLAHARFRGYRAEDLIELDSRAQAACTHGPT
jgi:hypothetical protein